LNVKYFIVKGKNKYTSVYVRFWDSKRIDQKTRTGIGVQFNDWSASKERIKAKTHILNKDFLNNQLEGLERYIFDSYNTDYNNRKYISSKWLKETVQRFFGRVETNDDHKIFFIDWIKIFIDDAHKILHNGKPIKARSINNYKTTLNKLKDFEKFQGTRYRFEDIDLNFHRDFLHYCLEEKKFNSNTAGNLITRIKTFCRNIELDDLPINPKYKHREFSAPKTETFDIYLNDDEINAIYNFDFSKSKKLDNARDLLIIGLRTGLRVSDFMRIKEENILGNVINITTQKTNQNLTVPIHPQFKEILKKRNGDFPKEISSQKFNLYIKDICEEAKINEQVYGSLLKKETKRKENGIFPKHKLVSSHTCRRSFATNLFLAGFDNSTIMKATGHSSEKQFIQYIKASHDEHIKKLSEYWDKQVKK